MKKYFLVFKSFSLRRKFFLYYVLITFAILFTLFCANSYFQKSAFRQAYNLTHNTLELHMETLDNQLNHTTSLLTNFLLMDYYHDLLDADTPVKKQNMEIKINNILSEQISLYSDVHGLVFYSPSTDTLLMQSLGYETYNDRTAIQKYIKEMYINFSSQQSSPKIQKWMPLIFNNHVFLFSIASMENTYIASWYRIESALSPLKTLQDTTKGICYLSSSDPDYVLFSIDSQIQKKENSKMNDQNPIIVSVSSPKNNYTLWIHMPKTSFLLNYTPFFNTLYILLALFFAFLLYTVIFTQKGVIKPINTLIAGMKSLQEGNFNTRIPIPENKDEFSEVMSTFNYMCEEITHLKMKIYEEALEKKRIELEYLTLQIKPHFFLNCLNVIYSLSISGKTTQIQQMSRYMMTYFRYLYKNSSSIVPLKEELEHVQAYLHLQEMRCYSKFLIKIDIPDEVKFFPIPVLSIQTFVENIFKHAYSSTENILVHISADMQKICDTDYIHIQIKDNGAGFPSGQLDFLNGINRCSDNDSGKHIGINNVKRRLIFLYNNSARLSFSNSEGQGALVNLYFPKQSQEN